MLLRNLLVAACACLFAGCSSWSSWLHWEPDQVLTASQRGALVNQQNWRLEGRVAVNSSDDAWHAGLDWHRAPETDYLLFSGPLGQGGMRLVVEQGGATLTDDDGQVRFIPDLQDFLVSTLHFEVPLEALKYWVLGIPQPGTPSIMSMDADGRVSGLEQHGWQIEYRSFMTEGEYVLPRKLAVDREGFALKLVVDDWQLDAPESEGVSIQESGNVSPAEPEWWRFW